MSIIDTLIIDRTQADAELARRLGAMGWAAMTDEQRALYLSDQLKGAYKASDLNRVNAAMDYLVGRLKAQGINVPIKRSKIPHKQSSSKRLPEGHNELKWIESTGTQYINTLFVPNNNTRVVADIMSTSTEVRWAFGARRSSNAGTYCFAIMSATSIRTDFGSANKTGTVADALARTVVDKDKEICKFGDTIITNTAETFSADFSLYLGTINTAGTAATNGFQGRYYPSQIYDNGTLVRDYIPDMLDSGEVGLYDMVEGKFYPNAGTGVFLAGPRRVELPEGFTQVEWIASSGAQYLNTKLTPNQDMEVYIQAVLTEVPSSAHAWLFGSRASTSSGRFELLRNYNGYWQSAYNTTYLNFTADNGQQAVQVKAIKNICNLNGAEVEHTYAVFQSSYNLVLFANNTAGAISNYCKARISQCRMGYSGVLNRDYIPCITAEGEGGLYDLVTNEFYGNAGSGAFTYGDVVEWEPLPDVEVLDDYTWYDSDVPTAALLAEHLSNVGSVRSALRAALPETPADMDDFTMAEANNIELVLVNMEQLINNMLSAWVYCAEIYSGEV